MSAIRLTAHGRRRTAVLVVAVAAGVAGCGNDSTDVAPTGPPAPHRGALTKIVYINPLPGNRNWDRIGNCMKAEASRHSVAVQAVGPPGGNVDLQAMQNMLSQAVATKAQAIVTWSIGAGSSFDPLFARARAQGGVVATLLSRGATKHQNFDIGIGQADLARMHVRAVARRPGRQYMGVISQSPAGPGNADYRRALDDELSKHPNVTLVDIQYDRGRFTEDVTIAGTMLVAHPEITALVNYSGAPGMLTAIKEKRRVGKVFAFMGSDHPETTLGYIDEGLIGGVRVSDLCLTGRLVVQKFLDAWAGKRVAPYYSNGARMVTGDEFRRLLVEGRV